MSDRNLIVASWDGEAQALRPLPRFMKTAEAHFVDTVKYQVEVVEQRSARSHSHYFATLTDIWESLPEEYGDRFPTMDHMRRFALIHEGFRDERSVVCASHAEALRVASFVKPIDEFAVVVVNEATVSIYTAKSQSFKAMGKEQFQESKQKTLDYCADLIERREGVAA